MSNLIGATAALLAGLVQFSFQNAFAQQTTSVASPAATRSYKRALALEKKEDTAGAIAALVEAIEKDPDFFAAHDEYIELWDKAAFALYNTKGPAAYEKARADSNAKIQAQYAKWAKAFPKAAGVQFGLGKYYSNNESPKAKPYLLRALAKNPKIAAAYQMLSIDAERWGDGRAARDYMRKAAESDPKDAGYAFYYANSFDQVDPMKYVELSLDVAKRFPNTERGAQSLYWLGERASADADKAKFWEMARTQFPPAKFDWSRSAMSSLFDLYARTDPQKALALADELAPIKSDYGNSWADNAALAKNLIEVRKLLDTKQFDHADALLEASKIGKYSSSFMMFALLKATAKAGAGNAAGAYRDLLTRYASTPEDAVREELLKLGTSLGRSAEQVDKDVWTQRDTTMKPAPDFSLDTYLEKGKRSLKDYRGKVVLLTFWFPGCGPCRGEFPHFENVLRRFKGKPVAYLGINVEPEQDAYVRPFMKGTHYTFTPLRGSAKFAESVYHVRGEPTNFLIDGTGRIVYSDFRASDPESERSLELMIESLLQHGDTG